MCVFQCVCNSMCRHNRVPFLVSEDQKRYVCAHTHLHVRAHTHPHTGEWLCPDCRPKEPGEAVSEEAQPQAGQGARIPPDTPTANRRVSLLSGNCFCPLPSVPQTPETAALRRHRLPRALCGGDGGGPHLPFARLFLVRPAC